MGEEGSKHRPIVKPAGRWIIAVTVTSALATGAFALYNLYQFINEPGSSQQTPLAAPQPVERVVTSLGRLEPRGDVIQLSASTSVQTVRVTQLLVSEGDKIRTGQVVAILDNRDRLQAALEKAKQEVKVTQANLAKVRAGAKQGEIAAQQATIARQQEQLRGEMTTQEATIARLTAQLEGERRAQQANIDRIEAELNNARTECSRFEQLLQEGAVTASERDRKCLEDKSAQERLNEAEATLNRIEQTGYEQLKETQSNRDKVVATLEQQVNEAKQTLNQIAEVRPVDIQEAVAEVENSLAAVKQAQADLELAYVRAPFDGQILKVHVRPGETVGSEGIVDLGQTDQMMAIAEVYESDIGKVRIGQQVIVTSETRAFDGELRGTVSHIGLQVGKKDVLSTDPAADVDSRVVEVKIRLDAASARRVATLTYSKVLVRIYL